MDTQLQLNTSSPIVQRVLRLRERMTQADAVSVDAKNTHAAAANSRDISRWQKWQKSDPRPGREHHCGA
ncbi:hypothetical protein EPA93_22230 [Ktedonosporobacter rubrisoli]|uniref:Uncharacterized protein n=1 Tax=Ktedonosporobacter rubrisoli TaxID=2509675 RepID=A0A4P6JT17_KTERU|nr:hypothetical protein [Ktedonosporobacter rubrisoli]QBD78564.1 hypothetical protein EPA93_22230 [Ktedonosporobacter rubrisoli]